MATLFGEFKPTLRQRIRIFIKGGARRAAITPRATIPNYALYGGATITRAVDYAGAIYVACCARKLSTDKFGFYIFKNGIEIPLTPFCTGRGSINNAGWWIAWNGSEYFEGVIPGFVGYPAPKNYDADIAQLRLYITQMQAVNAAQQTQINELETQLANATGGAIMDSKDRLALDRLRAGSDNY